MCKNSENRKCKTCIHWQMPKQGEVWIAQDIAAPENPIGYGTRYCVNPKIKFYKTPEADGATVVDGFKDHALLITGEDFGCRLHEATMSLQMNKTPECRRTLPLTLRLN